MQRSGTHVFVLLDKFKERPVRVYATVWNACFVLLDNGNIHTKEDYYHKIVQSGCMPRSGTHVLLGKGNIHTKEDYKHKSVQSGCMLRSGTHVLFCWLSLKSVQSGCMLRSGTHVLFCWIRVTFKCNADCITGLLV